MVNKCTSVTGTSGIVRPRFGPGMLLQHDDLELIVEYSTSLYRLVFRSLLGSGVICGLEVALSPSMPPVLTVQPGIALDGEGYPIYVPSEQSIRIDPCDTWTKAGVVVLRRQPKACANRLVTCSSGSETTLPTREIEGFELGFISSTPEDIDALVKKLSGQLEDARCSASSNAGWILLAKLKPDAEKGVDNKVRRSLSIPPASTLAETTPEPGDTSTGSDTVGHTDQPIDEPQNH